MEVDVDALKAQWAARGEAAAPYAGPAVTRDDGHGH